MPNNVERTIRAIDVTINSLKLKKRHTSDEKEVEEIDSKIEQLRDHRRELMTKYNMVYPDGD